MPLSDNVITSLNEIARQIAGKEYLSDDDTEMIKQVFYKILSGGNKYDVDEIESWFENESGLAHKQTIIRITNMSHYVQSRFEQNPKKFKILSNDDGCGCD
ncbi:MAG: hypothetical protein WAO91_07355 [Candidatus Nitrosotenuis sp.]